MSNDDNVISMIHKLLEPVGDIPQCDDLTIRMVEEGHPLAVEVENFVAENPEGGVVPPNDCAIGLTLIASNMSVEHTHDVADWVISIAKAMHENPSIRETLNQYLSNRPVYPFEGQTVMFEDVILVPLRYLCPECGERAVMEKANPDNEADCFFECIACKIGFTIQDNEEGWDYLLLSPF